MEKLATFAHGIHPPQHKADTCGLPIRQFPFAPVLAVPLLQHTGRAAIPVVREGQEVVRGECIARPDGNLSVAMHTPVTGVVERIALVPGIAGKMVPGIYLRPHPGSTQETGAGIPCELAAASPAQIIAAIQQAGIVGLGGAAFPTHVKLQIPAGNKVDTLLLNGVECEPWLTTDHRVMLEQPADIVTGIRYLLKASGAGRAIIGVEANKLDVVQVLRDHIPADLPASVGVLQVKYPAGAEKILVKALLGREIPSGALPLAVGVVVINVATAAEIGRLLPHGQGIQERVITITGPAIAKKGNYRIPLGTPLRFALEAVGVAADVSQVFLGGPMMGQSLPSLDIPITKGTSGFVAYGSDELSDARREFPCIHCGYCVDACPLFLNPARLGLLALNADYESMERDYHLRDCFECGACSYVCPAHIPLVQRFRAAKGQLSRREGTP
jgi:electron transport complex protein RnfC